MDTHLLVVNPGSASRKYSLYDGESLLCSYHFEYEKGQIIGQKVANNLSQRLDQTITSFDDCLSVVQAECQNEDISIGRIGLRLVAPGGYFLEDRVMDDEVAWRLQGLEKVAPLHISVLLSEVKRIKALLPAAKIICISDSRFHASKLEAAWNYGLPLDITDELELKRFGYHGISVASAVSALSRAQQLQPRMAICHLGSGSSVTAVVNGKSIDNSMGYSPFEGLIMSTRSGTVDFMALNVMKQLRNLDDQQIMNMLARQSGLLGLSGESDDLRVLLQLMKDGHHRAKLAIDTMVYRLAAAIGAMVACMGGIDGLVFTGTVGERSADLRNLLLPKLSFFGFEHDARRNAEVTEPTAIHMINSDGSKPVLVVAARENDEIAKRALAFN